jgi:hypothetical protein
LVKSRPNHLDLFGQECIFPADHASEPETTAMSTEVLEPIHDSEWEKGRAKRRSDGAKTAAKTRADNKLIRAYDATFGMIAGLLDSKRLKLMGKSLATGIDQLAEEKRRQDEEWERDTPNREREYAERVTYVIARRAALNAPLLAPITSEKEKEYTRLIKKRKLYEGACDLSWPEFFEYRDAHPGEVKPLSDDDLAYAGQWTACAVRAA